MATFLDIGLVNYFGVIFPILLVFVVTYAILAKSKIFGDNKGLHSLVAFALAMMLLLSPNVIKVISTMAPWFIFVGIFFILTIILFQFLGVEEAKIINVVSGEWGALHWIILGIIIIIMIGSLGSVFGGSFLPFTNDGQTVSTGVSTSNNLNFSTDTGDFNQNVGKTIFHPKVVGLIFVLLIGAATIRLIGT